MDETRPLSSGIVLTAALMEHAIDRDRVTEVDFGTGDDPYKRDWMEEVRARYRLTCLKRGNLRNWGAILRRQLRGVWDDCLALIQKMRPFGNRQFEWL